MEDFSKYLLKAASPISRENVATDERDSFSPVTDFSCDINATGGVCSPLFDFGEKLTFSPVLEAKKSNEVNEEIGEDKKRSSIKEDIAELEWKIEKCVSQIKEAGIRDVILTKQYKKKELVMKKIQEITKKIHANYLDCKKKSAPCKPVYYARDLRFEEGMSSMESSCMRSVREVCEMISSYFDKEFSKEVNLPVDPDEKNSDTSHLWSKAEDIFHNYTPSEICDALIKNIQQTTESLKELSSHIDLKRDAENLKFKFETGKLKDISSEPTLLKTVHQRIEMAQIEHFQRFVCTERASNGAWDMKKKLQVLNGEIDELLKKKFDHHQAELIRKYFHSEIDHESYLASYNFLQEELGKLRVELKQREEEIAELMKKYEHIQNFDKTVQAKQSIIQKLIQINGSAKSHHRQQHADIVKLVDIKIKSKQKEIFELSEKYKQLSGEELQVFQKVPIQNLNCIKQTNEDRKLVCDLSINRYNPHFHNPGDDSLKHVMKKTNLPAYAAPENLISNIMEMKEICYSNSEKVTSYNVRAKELADIHCRIANLTENLSKVYVDQFEALMPCVKECEAKTSEIMAGTLKFQDAAQTWWQQPAQFLVPWLTVEGLNIQQYIDEFSTRGELFKQMREQANPTKVV